MNSWELAKQLWNVYNKQEKYNTRWLVLFAYLYFLILKRAKYLANHEKNKKIKRETFRTSIKIKAYLEEHLIDTYLDAYKEALKICGREDLEVPTREEARNVVRETWVGDLNCIERQNRNTQDFLNKIKDINDSEKSEELKEAELEKALKHYRYTVYRLTRTESARNINTASLHAYEKVGIQYVEWVTAEDERVCEICGPRDRKVYPLQFVPFCPDHPNCRCVVIPVSSEEAMNRWKNL